MVKPVVERTKVTGTVIELRRMQLVSPFEVYPQLHSIWPADLTKLAMEGAQEAIDHRHEGDVGGLYVIERDGRVIGVTGFFYVADIEEPYLRWHGLIPSERRRGFSRAALHRLQAEIRRHVPHARGLTELVPLTPYGAEVAQHFLAMGFVATGRPETYDWSVYAWQPMRLALSAG